MQVGGLLILTTGLWMQHTPPLRTPYVPLLLFLSTSESPIKLNTIPLSKDWWWITVQVCVSFELDIFWQFCHPNAASGSIFRLQWPHSVSLWDSFKGFLSLFVQGFYTAGLSSKLSQPKQISRILDGGCKHFLSKQNREETCDNLFGFLPKSYSQKQGDPCC